MEQTLSCISAEAAVDLRASQFCFMWLNADGQVEPSSSGSLCDGVLQNAPAAGQAAQIAISGITNLRCAESITKGGPIASSTGGKGRQSRTGDYVLAKALAESSGDGVIIPALLVAGRLVAGEAVTLPESGFE